MKTMKKIFLLLFISLALAACMDEYTEEFTANSPIYLSYDELRQSVKSVAATDLVNPGKIYFKDGYLFVVEEFAGVHIIDNQNPANPQNIGFIEIPGNVDIAIKENILYADSYVDLLAIDISDINNPTVVKRVEDVLPYTLPPVDENYRIADVDEDKGVVTGWEIKKVRQEMEYHYYPYYRFGGAMEDMAYSSAPKANGSMASTFGVGGSMARFGLYDDYLYAVDEANLHIFDVKAAANPDEIGQQNVGWNVETMFMYDDHMFLGTQSGMRIFNLDIPTYPKYVSDFWHVTSCDPVVVADGYAYVTLRGGTACGSTVNRLDVLKLADDYVDNQLVGSYPMEGPYGLGIDDEVLFVCDGDAGLKVYDVSDKTAIDDHMISHFAGINTYDVIPLGGYLFMIGDDGFYQYDYSDLQNISQVSHIPVFQED